MENLKSDYSFLQSSFFQIECCQAVSPSTSLTINNQQSTVNSQQSTINSQQSTINNQQSTVNSQLSTVNCQLSTELLAQHTFRNTQNILNSRHIFQSNHSSFILKSSNLIEIQISIQIPSKRIDFFRDNLVVFFDCGNAT